MTRSDATQRLFVAAWFSFIESLIPWIHVLIVAGAMSLAARRGISALPAYRLFSTPRLTSSILPDGIVAFLLAHRFRTTKIRHEGAVAASSGALVGFLSACLRTIAGLLISAAHLSWPSLALWPLLVIGFVFQSGALVLYGAAAGWLLGRWQPEWSRRP